MCRAFCSTEAPVVPTDKLATLLNLTALHVNVVPACLVTLCQLQVLDLAQVLLERLPANTSALIRLCQLTISGLELPPSQVASLSNVPALKWLTLNRVPYYLLSPLERLTALKRLGLNVERQSSACLARMTHLTSLDLGVSTHVSLLVPEPSEVAALHKLVPALTHLSKLDLTVYHIRIASVGKQVLGRGMFLYPDVFVPLQQLLPHTKLSTCRLTWSQCHVGKATEG